MITVFLFDLENPDLQPDLIELPDHWTEADIAGAIMQEGWSIVSPRGFDYSKDADGNVTVMADVRWNKLFERPA